MRATTRKGFRDLARQRAQVSAVGVTIMLGVMLYVATAGAFLNLSDSYRQTYDRLHFADLIATGPDAQAVADAALTAGATAAITRIQADPPMRINGTALVGRVISLPDSGQAAVDNVDMIAGSYLDPGAGKNSGADQVLLEKHAADTFGLKPGDTLEVFGGGTWHTATVQGIVVSPEYIWAARSRQEVIADPNSFAVVFASESLAHSWLGATPTQALALLPPGTNADASGPVATAMRGAGAHDVVTWREQASQATLQEDLNGFKEMSVAFPLLFLTAAGVSSYVMLARRILRERPIIGTLMASGARRGRVLRHYLSQGVIVGLGGAVVGVILGAAANGAVTSAYTGALGIPDTVVRTHAWMLVAGLAFGVVVGLLGAFGPALTASRTAPAEAMRQSAMPLKPGSWSRFVARLSGLPVSTRMALRDVGRNRRRTLATALGGVLALVIVIASVGMMTSMLDALHIQYHDVSTQDATVTVASGGVSADALAAVPGVTAVEPTVVGNATAVSGDRSYATTLQGFEPGTAMHGFLAPDGSSVALPKDGVLAGQALTGILHVKVGDTITLTIGGKDHQVVLAGLVDEPLGTALYATNAVASGIVPSQGLDTYLLSLDSGANHTQLRNQITGMNGVVAYQDANAIVGIVDQYLGLFYAFIGVMIALGSVLALAMIYVTMAVSVAERTGELATLRAAGVSVGKVARTIATENLLATTLGLPFGLGLGVLAARAFLASFSNDLFNLQLSMPWWMLPACAVGVLAAAGLSQWPAVRSVRRVDVAKVVRERAA
ncbi:ABC transporter permease [Demequina lutea]|uniref:Putative ABC transport system permease protein n=1 Tax=Demequina lutea TaxID=431489 RepID=A0A7Y9Z8V1_9MICO|nr:FtsX-like permease family protein [Demequina lutea]NYI40113.1 putative ABC transport system permease protein [Demequina lutea]